MTLFLSLFSQIFTKLTLPKIPYIHLPTLLSSLFQSTISDASKEAPQRILWGPVGMGIGIAIYFYLPKEPPLAYSVIPLILSTIVFALWRRHSWGRFIAWPLLCITLGFALIHLRVTTLDTQMLDQRLEKISLIAQVHQIDIKEGKTRLILKNIKTPEGASITTAMARLSLSKKTAGFPQLGDHVRLIGTLMPLSAPLLPGGYDFRRTSFFQGIGATGWVDEMIQIIPCSQSTGWIWLQSLRQTITHELLRLVPGPSGAISAALVTGERGHIKDEIRQAYTDAGIAHVLAISGLHLSLIAGIIFMLIRRGLCLSLTIAEAWDLKKIASVATIPFLLIYLLISGMGVPAVRSFIMVATVMIAVLLNRQAISLRLLAFAAFVIILIQPECVLSASFALSFAAVMGLVSVYQGGWIPFQKWVLEGGWMRQIIAYVFGIIITTLIASAVTTPISMAIFNRLSIQAILGNLVAIPLTGFIIMPALLLLVLSIPFGGFGMVGAIASWAIDILTKASVYTANLPGAAIPIPQPPSAFLWLFVMGILWLLLWREKWRYWGFVPVVASFAVLMVPQDPMILLDSKGYVAWYDGKELSNFADSNSPFTEDVLKRHFGCTQMKDEVGDTVNLSILGNQIMLMNGSQRGEDRESKARLGKLIRQCQDNDLIITRYPLRLKCRADEAMVLETGGKSWPRQKSKESSQRDSKYITFTPKGFTILHGRDRQGNRPWTVNSVTVDLP